ncbi:60S ribosomal protein L18A-1 [Arabidopsis thaliana]|uniref:60S ribosomal protein L18A-1 n=1 Tax=Arabidopsis thaliana TaxID=3702 RepID=F4I376_ARATH|nr:60S ribosomal protein L18A-1 [Arabidopsis thaliana]AEE31162.1 60S ribosomal protein L18A-1 [Arabidopsis thaliana]|eukprot:NP_001154385.1 60S ribosomal protein L18A-1 [Arabidopsis thaliana]
MDEEAAKPRDSTVNQQHQYYYGTFQGVANFPTPTPPPQFMQPQHPITTFPGHAYQNLQGHGGGVNYAQGFPVVVPDYTVVEVRPMIEHELPCCGLGMGWFLSKLQKLRFMVVGNSSLLSWNLFVSSEILDELIASWNQYKKSVFIMGFLFGGIPWYLGAFIVLVTSVDHREKAGYVACSIASVVYLIAVMLGMTGDINIW